MLTANSKNFISPNAYNVLLLQIAGTLSGLTRGSHGFHVHQNGAMGVGCADAGSHFNPCGVMHGGPNDEHRHVGDLGNIVADTQGQAHVLIHANNLSLEGPNSIVGRSVVIHVNMDDQGKGGTPESASTGHSGARAACGVIGIIDPMQ
ncbi:unnamed protein product, partial [Gongylonema pulchrum]